ncbi:AMP-binding protein [Gordonia sp. 852002-10350_SCH5691597]|uniref:AMP-binding protein n=1 Tax=Gordonia sp. 852002-10350_SCH5691597 TaxID=1834085 RepID=UPI0007E97EF0|nr:AMP-binding protein [Gordonia sp. 852002-10350_SCH5691597]OBA70922.1 fatty-acid--CoA ligase [Gordonia sp. 852002-10350_SCH5691597]
MYPPTIARDHPDADAYVMAGSGESLTYGQLDAASNQLAHHWRTRGVGPGDSAVIAMENNLAWPIAVAAGMRSGLYVTPVNWHLKPAELAALLVEARPRAVVTSATLADDVVEALRLAGLGDAGDSEVDVTVVGGSTPGYMSMADALQRQPTTPIADERLGARVLYSGGTTGRPKRFAQQLLDVHPAQAPQRHSGLVEKLGIDESTVLLSPAPNYHAAPFTFGLITLAAGGTVICMERFDARAAMDAITRYGVTHSQWVPTMLIRLLRLSDRADVELSGTHRTAFTSGAPCPPEVKEQLAQWWGPILHEYYGASEGYGHTYIGPDEAASHPGSVGRPLGATRISIVDDDGNDLPEGERGRVCFEQTTPSAYDNAGPRPARRQMGDIGYLRDGYLYLVGRAGHMIISGGVNIYPEEVEEVVLSHPDVLDGAVLGVPDPEFGESVKAVVQRTPGSTLTAQELIDFCRDRLAHYKTPRVIDFVDELPRLPTGKLNKKTLADTYGQTPTPEGEKV